MKKIKASEGKWLTQVKVENEDARVFSEMVYAADDDADNWREADAEEKLKWELERKGETMPSVEEARDRLLAAIDQYDTSDAVNAFVLGGQTVAWSNDDDTTPNKNVRMGLRQNIADKKAKGEADITMWLGGRVFTLPCDTAEHLLLDIENYAYDCFNVTARHKAEILGMNDVVAIMQYDITEGYPKKISIEL